MAIIELETLIHAPIERCFDLARDVDVHCQTTAFTQERAVAGRTHGLLELGDTITFEAVHFGVRQKLTGRMTDVTRPTRFADVMVEGAFAALTHVHEFFPAEGGTRMRDTLTFTAPFGIIGRIAERLFLETYMRRFLERRNRELKRVAESDEGAK